MTEQGRGKEMKDRGAKNGRTNANRLGEPGVRSAAAALGMAAMPLPGADADRLSKIEQAWCMLANTSPYNYTGNPAISVPCGRNADGLPAGLQLIGRHYDERTIYRAAAAFEANFDWQTS